MHESAKRIVALGLVLAAAAIPQLARADGGDYEHDVRVQIVRHVTYPRLAKMRQQEGTVGYSVTLDPKGGVSDVVVETSSGNPTLDTAAVDAIKEAAPFPTPPSGGMTVKGAIKYKLD